MKSHAPERANLAEKMTDARERCLTRLRMVPRERREAAADAILALAEPDWWERRQKGDDVFLLILELRKDAVLKIIQEASK